MKNSVRLNRAHAFKMQDEQAVIFNGWPPINFRAKPTFSERTNDDAQPTHDWLSAQYEFAGSLRGHPDPCTVADSLARVIAKLFPGSSGVVRLLNEHSGELELVSSASVDRSAGESKNEAGVADAAVLQERTRTAIHANSSRSQSLGCAGHYCSLAIPLTAQVGTLGVVEIFSKERHSFTRNEVEFLTTLATQAALAIENFELVCQMRQQRLSLWHADLELKKFDRIKSDFLSRMSHEFKTPLTVIHGYAEMMRDALLGGISEEQKSGLDEILRASGQLTALVLSLLEAGGIECGAVQSKSEMLHLSRFLDELKSEISIPHHRQLQFVWDYPADLPSISTDAEKLKHVLRHLIDNAIKFTRRGRVTVSCRCSAVSKVEIKVADTGVGIPKQMIPSLFRKFQQMDGSSTRTYEGAGLGLYLAQHWCRILGAELSVTSEIGVGSAFTVALPLPE